MGSNSILKNKILPVALTRKFKGLTKTNFVWPSIISAPYTHHIAYANRMRIHKYQLGGGRTALLLPFVFIVRLHSKPDQSVFHYVKWIGQHSVIPTNSATGGRHVAARRNAVPASGHPANVSSFPACAAQHHATLVNIVV